MVVAEARRPPVFQQVRREEIAIVASFEIAIVHQNFECILNSRSRLKKSLPLTQRPVDDLMVFSLFNRIVVNKSVE